MAGVAESIVVGIASGVLTSVLLLFLAAAINKIAIPWYQGIVYRGIDYGGEWRQEFSFQDKGKDTFVLHLKQHGHEIRGILSVVHSRANEPDVLGTMELKAQVIDGYIKGLMKSVDPKRLALGTLLLKSHSGKQLEGLMTYRVADSGEITYRELSLERMG